MPIAICKDCGYMFFYVVKNRKNIRGKRCPKCGGHLRKGVYRRDFSYAEFMQAYKIYTRKGRR